MRHHCNQTWLGWVHVTMYLVFVFSATIVSTGGEPSLMTISVKSIAWCKEGVSLHVSIKSSKPQTLALSSDYKDFSVSYLIGEKLYTAPVLSDVGTYTAESKRALDETLISRQTLAVGDELLIEVRVTLPILLYSESGDLIKFSDKAALIEKIGLKLSAINRIFSEGKVSVDSSLWTGDSSVELQPGQKDQFLATLRKK